MSLRPMIVGMIVMAGAGQADPLPSWNDTDAKARITEFVARVTDVDGDSYVSPAERIAVFDNDGTLWVEQPVYTQLLFAVNRVAELAREDPSILTSDALKAAAAGDIKGVFAQGRDGLFEVISASHSGISVDEFTEVVQGWMQTARHPDTGRAFDDMTYQPMLELLRYLREEGFTTYIVSGGSIHFMRAFADAAYNIPPQQVIGTILNSSYQVIDGDPVVMKDPGLFFNDDKEGKPIAIDTRIGRRPIFAAGNSDGDFQMLEWTTAGEGARFGMIVHHTDAEREYAYDRDSSIGGLERGLDEAGDRGWLLVDMAEDWKTIWSSGE